MAKQALMIDRRMKGDYADIIDVCHELGPNGKHGTAPTALVWLLKESPTFVATLKRLRESKAPENKDT